MAGRSPLQTSALNPSQNLGTLVERCTWQPDPLLLGPLGPRRLFLPPGRLQVCSQSAQAFAPIPATWPLGLNSHLGHNPGLFPEA